MMRQFLIGISPFIAVLVLFGAYALILHVSRPDKDFRK